MNGDRRLTRPKQKVDAWSQPHATAVEMQLHTSSLENRRASRTYLRTHSWENKRAQEEPEHGIASVRCPGPSQTKPDKSSNSFKAFVSFSSFALACSFANRNCSTMSLCCDRTAPEGSCKGGGTLPICVVRVSRQTPGVLVAAVAMAARGGQGLAEDQQTKMA